MLQEEVREAKWYTKIIIDRYNRLHPTLKFTAEWSDSSVMFLDTKVALEEVGIITDLHIKLTDTHQHLQCRSCYPNHCEKGIPYSQAPRMCRICT